MFRHVVAHIGTLDAHLLLHVVIVDNRKRRRIKMNEQNTKVLEHVLDRIVEQTPCDCHNQATGFLVASFLAANPEINLKKDD